LVRIQIDTTNDAFKGSHSAGSFELARILRELADRVASQPIDDSMRILDVNGNTVGKLEVE